MVISLRLLEGSQMYAEAPTPLGRDQILIRGALLHLAFVRTEIRTFLGRTASAPPAWRTLGHTDDDGAQVRDAFINISGLLKEAADVCAAESDKATTTGPVLVDRVVKPLRAINQLLDIRAMVHSLERKDNGGGAATEN